ncbi:MAG: hypothetical protein V1723_04195 [Candidatus Uhrbacteria bacterium]
MKMQDSILYERFPEVFEDFFSTHDVVLSSCLSYAMYRELSWRSGAPDVTQKLPFRIYVGLRSSGSPGRITLGTLRAFVPLRDKFIQGPDAPFREQVVTSYLERYCTEIFGRPDFPGMVIDVLQDRVEDLCVDAGTTTLILGALGLLAGRWSPSDLEQISALPSHEFTNADNPYASLYRVLHTDVMRYHTDALSLSAFGGSAFTTVIASDFPIVYCTEERGGSIAQPADNLFPMNVIGHSDRLCDLRWWGFRLNEISNARGEFPLDIAIINPVSDYQEYISMSTHIDRSVIPAFDDLAAFSRQMAEQAHVTGDRLPAFLKGSNRPGMFWATYARAGTVVVMNCIRSLINLYEHPHASTAIMSFFETIFSSTAMDASFLETQSPRMRRLIERIRLESDESGTPIGLCSFAIGSADASVIIYSPKGSFRKEVTALVNSSIASRHQVSLDYASWEHGYGSGGIRVDQYRTKGIISPVVRDYKYVLISRDPKGEFSAKLIKDVQEAIGRCELLIDRVSDQIFVRGRACTSSDLPTQKAAAQLLDFLFDRLCRSVPNDQLPPSTYVKYRNELQGKILSPLDMLLRKRIKKELGLKIHGKLTSFSVTWNPGKLRVGILKRMSK